MAERAARTRHPRRVTPSRSSSPPSRGPAAIILMVKAGAPVDAVIAELTPLLEPGDIVIDGGNSYFPDTERRAARAGRSTG